MWCINPHGSPHPYSYTGLWCPLNQSVKHWPDGASPAHPPQWGRQKGRGRGVYTPHHITQADTAVQRYKQNGLGRKRRKCEGALLNNEARGEGRVRRWDNWRWKESSLVSWVSEIERFKVKEGENSQYQERAIGRDPGWQHLHRLVRYVCVREGGREVGRDVVVESVWELDRGRDIHCTVVWLEI